MQSLSKLLANAPGHFGNLARLIDAALPCSEAALSLPAALSLFATLKCGRIVSETGIHPNIYTAVIADSGSGKTQAQKIVSKILAECELSNLRCGVPTSDTGLCKRLAESNRQIIIWDEFGAELEALAGSKNSFEKRILKAMMELYSLAGSVYIGKQYATQDRIDVNEPYLNCFAGTTGIRFFGALNEKFMHDGFLSRWILFFPQEQSLRRVATPFMLTDELIEYIGQLESWVPKSNGNLAKVLGKCSVPLRYDCKATEGLHERVITELTAKLDRQRNGSIERVFWIRAVENYIKILIAISDHEIVSYDSVCWASDLIESCIRICIEKCSRHIRPSDLEAVKDKLLNVIPIGQTMTRTEVARKTYHLNLKGYERDDLIKTFIEAELWSESLQTINGSRKKSTTYKRLEAE